jgi:hypothetical protein
MERNAGRKAGGVVKGAARVTEAKIAAGIPAADPGRVTAAATPPPTAPFSEVGMVAFAGDTAPTDVAADDPAAVLSTSTAAIASASVMATLGTAALATSAAAATAGTVAAIGVELLGGDAGKAPAEAPRTESAKPESEDVGPEGKEGA